MASAPYSTDPSLRRRPRGGALSCAECRRLKLKCSRVFPCNNCVKKGCGQICPDGSLTTGKGNRFVLANTEELHDKITVLATRVRQLEDALAQSHSSNHPNTQHPLLSVDLLQLKRPLERERFDEHPSPPEPVENPDAINALGSLSLSERGKSSFFGPGANSWYLLKNEEGSEEEHEEVSPFQISHLPSDIPWLAHVFPFASVATNNAENIRRTLIGFLPAETEASRLCQLYYQHAAWMYTPITHEDFLQTIFRPVYGQGSTDADILSPHNLALLFMVLAMGALTDLDLPAHSPQAMQYFHLGRAALAIKPIFEDQSIQAIQTLLLMCHFMFWNDDGARWVVMGLIVKLAQGVGLHRDPTKWGLDPQETYRRRCLTWEILTYDSWQSLTYGRPPSFSMIHVDTKMPHQENGTPSPNGEMSFEAWKHAFVSQAQAQVHDQAFGARPPSYKTLQELDKKVRSYYVPPSLQVPGFGGAKLGPEPEQPTAELTMQRYISFAIKEITLFYMHRGFFAQALDDSPNDPMGSKYAQSVLAAYTSACSFVGLIESLFRQYPQLTERMWFLFTHVFSCAIVLGSIAGKAEMALAPSALSHLESAYHLFSQVSEVSRTSKILAVLYKLKERAHEAISKARGHIPPTQMHFGMGPQPLKTEKDAELAGLGGMTRLVRRGTSNPSSPSSNQSASPVSNPSSPPTSNEYIPTPTISEAGSQWALNHQQPHQPLHLQQHQQQPRQQHPHHHRQHSHSQQRLPQQQQQYSPTHVAQYSPQDQYPSIEAAYSMYSAEYNVPQTQHGMGLDMMPTYYGFDGAGTMTVEAGSYRMQHPEASEFAMQPDHDLTLSWNNFMSQYK
ncbi:hypothetical protein CYLTODRAFT_419434 [Cylindrobasidium torrendii FP15055 ss-10]|uniref:Zn(2)-C6 fungal-type domain-containing protein n=1 Tax=Cylindrobasidium torrendii FP15055 ss-10 TaxID=1314674 RepID=A0A0D7BKM7_9AGAR|nr:hypothetical protein CYLTODRAFT_419434 [Cylindrobasidium torrendii FP15055 ss-10]